jgi:hypothetical protein
MVQIYNAVVLTHHFPSARKQAQVISNLQPGKDPAQPSSYLPICLLDTIVKLFENIFLTCFVYEVGECGLMRNEKFGF